MSWVAILTILIIVRWRKTLIVLKQVIATGWWQYRLHDILVGIFVSRKKLCSHSREKFTRKFLTRKKFSLWQSPEEGLDFLCLVDSKFLLWIIEANPLARHCLSSRQTLTHHRIMIFSGLFRAWVFRKRYSRSNTMKSLLQMLLLLLLLSSYRWHINPRKKETKSAIN